MALEATPLLVDGDARERFAEDGYVILDNPCPAELLDDLRTEFEARFKDPWHPGPQVEVDGVVYDRNQRAGEWHWHRIKNAWKISDKARAVALNESILETLESLFGRKVMPFQTLNFPVGTQQSAHSDSFHFQSDPAGFMCGVWIALEDMDMENGPLVYYPGSHKLPLPTVSEIELQMGETLTPENYQTRDELLMARNQLYERYCARLLQREDMQPEYGTIRKGQALVWAPNLLHGGAPQTDQSRSRHSQVTHYFFEGCRVYTPMHSDGDHNFWYYPEWIRDPVPAYSEDFLRMTIEANVPRDAECLVLTNAELPNVDDRQMKRFPTDDDGNYVHLPDDRAIEALEDARSRGARFIVIPKERLQPLVYGMPRFQAHIEDKYRPVVRDGAVCAIYGLD